MKLTAKDQRKSPFEIYVCRNRFLAQNHNREFVELNEKMLRSRLYLHGWPRPKRAANGKPAEDTVAPLLEEISQTKQVDLYAPLAGYTPGFYTNNGYRVVVTNAPDLIPAVKGDWSIIKALFERQQGEQLPYFYTWWKFARWRLLTHTFIPLQAMALVGKPNAGKTTVLHLLSKSLGRKANPFQFIVSDTSFNEDLAAATLHLIDDEHSHMDREKQKRLFDYYKWTTVKPSHRVHPKGQKAYELNLIAVPVTACNMDSPEDLKTIPPPFESDMGNRMHIFHCLVAPMPMPTKTPEEKQAFYAQLESQLPAFHYFLDHEWEMPPELADPQKRFPCKAWQDPVIVELVTRDSRVMQFRTLVLKVIQAPHRYTAADILQFLAISDLKQIAYNVVRDVQTCGNLLAQWRKLKPLEIGAPKPNRDGINEWPLVLPVGSER